MRMDQHHPDIDRLIGRYLSRKASPTEIEVLEEWLNASPQNRETLARLEAIWGMPLSDEYSTRMEGIRDQIWAAGLGEEHKGKKQLRRELFAPRWLKIAAVLVLLLTGGWFSTVVFEDRRVVTSKSVAWIEKINHAGQRSSHLLPDGTKVWLNVESRMTFPEQFSDTLRQVQLVGEAYFEVAKDEKKPFVVNTADISTVVLGTSFNVRAYPEDDEIKVALLEGKVRVQAGQEEARVMLPGDEIVARKEDLKLTQSAFEYASTFGWKEGVLVFDGVGFNDFRNALEKWYGVKVEVHGKVPADWSIRARYKRESLQHVLEDISFNKNMMFQLKGKKVTITF
jgi:transmembrane sensor